MFISLLDPQQVIRPTKTNLRKNPGPVKKIQSLPYYGEGVPILHGLTIYISIINTESKPSIWLLSKDDWCRKW